jgi:glycosyltransferase involved in cell wall biosynthesis
MSALDRAGTGTDLDANVLVVLSHLRWEWVWQRPQHIISRLARTRPTIFVEEPLWADVAAPAVCTRNQDGLTRLWLQLPRERSRGRAPEYGRAPVPLYSQAVRDRLGQQTCDVWLYAPTALPIAESLDPRLLVYDVMDDLSSFADATPETKLLMRRALARADVAFAGGRSLHRSAAAARGDRPTFLFPSGVEWRHYAGALDHRRAHQPPVAGYVGVIDERMDLELLGQLAELLGDWTIRLIGPITKIDPDSVPRAANIELLGQQPYEHLPELMAGLDVALMPFALNEATRSISPTKTLEYLAAGLPVISTRVPDVVSDWDGLVHLADDAAAFAAGCRAVVTDSAARRAQSLAPLLARYEWDWIVQEMTRLSRRAPARDATSAAA